MMKVLLLTEVRMSLKQLFENRHRRECKHGSSTRLYDAGGLTIKERLNKIKGRKAIVPFLPMASTRPASQAS